MYTLDCAIDYKNPKDDQRSQECHSPLAEKAAVFSSTTDAISLRSRKRSRHKRHYTVPKGYDSPFLREIASEPSISQVSYFTALTKAPPAGFGPATYGLGRDEEDGKNLAVGITQALLVAVLTATTMLGLSSSHLAWEPNSEPTQNVLKRPIKDQRSRWPSW